MKKKDLDLIVVSMGQFFKVVKIAYSEKEANDYTCNHENCGVIGEREGAIFIAENFESI